MKGYALTSAYTVISWGWKLSNIILESPWLDLLSHSAITRINSGSIALEEKYSLPGIVPDHTQSRNTLEITDQKWQTTLKQIS